MQYPNMMPDPQRQVSFSEAIQSGFNKYVDFTGRASRSEYWWWTLFAFIVNVGASVVSVAVGSEIVTYIVSLAMFLPGLGVACRRLHDIGKGAGYIFLALIPVVGAIILIVWFTKPSEPFPNRFGNVPNLSYNPNQPYDPNRGYNSMY